MTSQSLAGRRILVTRPEHQAGPLIEAIAAAGGTALHLPVMQITGKSAEEVRALAASLPAPDITVFVSRNAVDFGIEATSTASRIAAIGPATAAALEAFGRNADIVAAGADSESLLDHEALQDVAGSAVTIVRGEDGRTLLGDELTARSATVSYLPVYRREQGQPRAEQIDAAAAALQAGEIDAVVVMSVASLDFLLAILPGEAHLPLRQTPLVAPGERVIIAALKRLPGNPAIQADGPDTGSVLKALTRALRPGRD